MGKRGHVAIVGAGSIGVVSAKNFLEEDFDVTVFERNDWVGGIWHFSEDINKTSGLPTTEWNGCIQTGCYTDFPFPPGSPDFPMLPEVQSYIEAYCAHFSLNEHIRLSTTVIKAVPIENGTKWSLTLRHESGKESNEIFDKLIIAIGQVGKPLLPAIQGLDHFKGRVLHAQAYKRPSDFDNQKVLVLGSSNTAMDCAAELTGHAKKVYLSHRNGGMIVPRRDKYGLPVHFTVTLRMQTFGRLLERITPSLWANLWNKTALRVSEEAFGVLPPEWRFNNPPKGQMANPIVNDKIVDHIRAGQVTVVPVMKSVTDLGEIELSNGDILSDVDTIILCTGYKFDFSIVPEDVDPGRHRNPKWDDSGRTNGRRLPRLYQGFISLEYPNSLAFIGCSGYPSDQMPLYDLVTMALAQIWKGAVPIPPRSEMEAEVNKRHEYLVSLLLQDQGNQVLPYRMDAGRWVRWLHETAGTGMNERFTYSLQAWWNWLTNMSWISELATGVNSPHFWRLFDGRRKKWDGAEAEIKRLNEDARRRKEEAIKRLKELNENGKSK